MNQQRLEQLIKGFVAYFYEMDADDDFTVLKEILGASDEEIEAVRAYSLNQSATYHVEVEVVNKEANDLSVGRLMLSENNPGKWALDLYGPGHGFATQHAGMVALADFIEQMKEHNDIKGTVFQYEKDENDDA